MGLLVLATYSLMRNAPSLQTGPAVQKPRTQSDYFIKNFSVKSFDETGRLTSIIYGQFGKHYEERDFLEVDHIRFEAFDKEGKLSTGRADKGLVYGNTDEVELLGNVRINRAAGLDNQGKPTPAVQITGEAMHGFGKLERFVAKMPVTITRDRDVLSADQMDYDKPSSVTLMQGRVKGQFHPKP